MDYQEAFVKCFQRFGAKHHRYQVIADFALFGTDALHKAVTFSQELEGDYLQGAKRYSCDELNHHAELLGLVVCGLEASWEDFLGNVFMQLQFGNNRAGQFLTSSAAQ